MLKKMEWMKIEKRGIDGLVNKNKWEIEWKIGVFDLREIGKRGENKIKKYFLK